MDKQAPDTVTRLPDGRVVLIDEEKGTVLIYNPNVSETAALFGWGWDVLPLSTYRRMLAEDQPDA